MIDWETAYDNRRAVPASAAMQADWQARSAAFAAAAGPRHRRIGWGGDPRQAVHLVVPEGAARGLAVFVHGGYWMRNAPEDFLVVAQGPLARGWAVALPGYRLCPAVRIADITRDVAAGIAAAAGEVAGPLRISGHSAGGHLAARMLCPGVLPAAVLARVAGAVPISGLHDLRPLRRTPMNPTLRIDAEEALAESPAFAEPAAAVPVTAWVGGAELPELRRQSRILAEVWGGLGVATALVEPAGQDHFTVIEPLADPDSPLTRALTGD